MIYEFRTYQIKAGSLPIVIEKFQEKIDGRNNISKIGAFWYTEIGPLNQIIHVCPYGGLSCPRFMRNAGAYRTTAPISEDW